MLKAPVDAVKAFQSPNARLLFWNLFSSAIAHGSAKLNAIHINTALALFS